MRNKLILFLMLALFGSASFLRADEVTIGDPTATTGNSYLPMYSLYNYSFSQQIYTAAELGIADGAEISAITLWLKTTASEPTRSFEIYMTTTTQDVFATGDDWVPMVGTDLVYSGSVTPTDAFAPYTFTLSNPFTYTGGNLVIAFRDLTGTWKSGFSGLVYGDSTDPKRAMYLYRDSESYDINALPAASSYNLTGVKDVLKVEYTTSGAPLPPPPATGDLTVTPNPFHMGARPTRTTANVDVWMEPYNVKIENGGHETPVEGVISNVSGLDPFTLSDPINTTLATDESIEFDIEINRDLPDGDYAEEFTLYYTESAKSMLQIELTASFYTPVEADVVEDYGTIDPVVGAVLNPTGMYPNYRLYGLNNEMLTDAVYKMSFTADVHFHADMDKDGAIYVFNYEDVFHPVETLEPVGYAINGDLDKTFLAGNYFFIVAAEELNAATINVNATEITTAPTTLVYTYPANYATEVTTPLTLTWDNDPDATEYQVLFGTTYAPVVVQDWTLVEGPTGSFTIDNLDDNTQYFWQIKNRNSVGTLVGELWGFTTPLIPPTQVEVVDPEIFTDGSTLIKWRGGNASGFTGEITVADGTSTSSYIPVYGLWMDDFTRSEIIYPESMLADMIGGEITSLKYYISSPSTGSWAPASFNVYMMEVASPTFTVGQYFGSATATVVYTGGLDGTGTEMVINLSTPYTYNGGNLLIGIEEPVVGTYHSCSFYGIQSTGSSASGYSGTSVTAVTYNQRDFIPKTTFTCGGRSFATNRTNRSFRGYNVYVDGTKINTELVTERQYLYENPIYNMPAGHDVHVTCVYDEGESLYDHGSAKVYVSGYGDLEGDVTELVSGGYLAGVTVTFSGQDEFGNNVQYTATTNDAGHYKVTVKDGVYDRGVATLDGYAPALMGVPTATVTEGGTTVVDFIMHETYKPVYKVYAEELEPATAKVTWSLSNFIPGVPGATVGDEFTVDFESGMPAGWTTLDVDGDGDTWQLGSVVMSSGYGHNGSNDMILSRSYDNNYGPLTPDNYLVSPQVTVGTGATFSFYACAQDASYAAEHFGVAISTGAPTAADFTMLQEWTMSAKGSGVMAPGRNGETRAQGTWYQYTIDLNDYAGQQVYLAIRHFNCTDWFYLDVDDIVLTNGADKGGDRSVDHFTIVRKAVIKEGGVTAADSVYLATVPISDTLYADFDWYNCEPGLYQYGVRSVYPGGDVMKGNRVDDELTVHDGTTTNSYVPVYGLYTDAYLKCQYIMTEDLLGDMVGGTINGMTFYFQSPASASWGAANFQVYMMPYANATISAFEDLSSATMVYEGPLDGTQPTMEVTFATPYNYTGGNLLIAFYNTAIGSWKSCAFYGEEVTGACVQGYNYSSLSAITPTQRNFVPKTTFHYDAGSGTSADDPTTAFTWSNYLPKDMGTVITVNAVATTGSVEGAAVLFENVNAETYEEAYTYEGELDENGEIVFDDFRKGQYKVSITLDGFISEYNETIVDIWDEQTITAHFVENILPVEDLVVSGTGFARWTDMLPATDAPERYIVKLEEVFQGETTNNYMQLDVTDLVPGNTYTAGVALVYTTGMSAFTTANFTYIGCDAVTTDVDTLWMEWDEENHWDIVLNWNEGSVTPPTPPTPPVTGDEFDFESGMQGWTNIDADGDGNVWDMGTDSGHNSTGYVTSESYINYVGPLTPDNYLVSPNKAAYTTMSFWANAQDASYPSEHFGVAVSTTNNTDPSAFTTIQEWTMTAKSSGVMGMGRDGEMRAQGTWYQYTVDLSAYAGQEIYVAIRHFDCTDWFRLNVDDIVLGTDAKLGGTLSAASVGYGQAATDNRDGNWYYYDNGVNADAIGTNGGNFWWGVMFPAGSFDGNKVTKVAAYDYMNMTGTVTIYQGGTSAPGMELGSTNVTFTGAEDFVEFTFASPITIDPSMNVWVVFYNASGATYPAAVCANTGDPNGRWVSLDGSTWEDIATYGLDYTFMVRAYIETSGGGGGAGSANITPNKFNILVDGEFVGATGDNTYTVVAEDYIEHCYTVVYVDGTYNISCGKEICFAVPTTDVNSNDVVNRIYPNPTNGNLHIDANDMTRVTVVSTLGQVVYDARVSGNETVINMGRFNAGVYMVNIVTKNGTSVKRVVVTK